MKIPPAQKKHRRRAGTKHIRARTLTQSIRYDNQFRSRNKPKEVSNGKTEVQILLANPPIRRQKNKKTAETNSDWS
jgi:hypothetical protein